MWRLGTQFGVGILAVLGLRLDSMNLDVFSNLNVSMILWISWRVKCPGGWQSVTTTRQLPSAPTSQRWQLQTLAEQRFTRSHLSAARSVAPALPWPGAMVSVRTHQTSSKTKPQYAALQSRYQQGVQQDKLCKHLHVSETC